jgi:O-antigen ligase
MSDILAFGVQYGLWVFLFVLAALVPVLGVGLTLTRPALLTLAYISILLSFGQSNYGALEIDRTIYSRGTGQLFFSFLTWILMGLAALGPFLARWSSKKPVPTNLGIPFMMLALLFAGHLIASPRDVNIFDVLSSNGFINLLFLGLLVYVMTRTLNERFHLIWLEWLLLSVGAVRATYGLVRWAVLGGDPANFYENRQHLGVKLTYFDICDSMIAGVVLVYCLRRLFANWGAMRVFERLLLITLATMEFSIIALSYRREAWGGLALLLAFFALLLPLRQRIAVTVVAPFLALAVLIVASTRLGKVAHGQGLSEQFLFDLYSGGSHGREPVRAIELKAALETILDNPMLGVGAWGRYRGAVHIPWQIGPDAFSFVHSGILHILLKTGLVGAAIVSAALFFFIRFVIYARRTLADRDRWLVDAALAGLIFMIVDFLIGTPIIQFRTMLLCGVMIAIPYLVAEIARRERAISTQ